MNDKKKMSSKKESKLRKRFKKEATSTFRTINSSIDFDKFLYQEDIEASIAHAKMLTKQKIIKRSEYNKISQGLKKILSEIKLDKFDFNSDYEDIHMNIENRLQQLIGDTAGKLHTARSRNDQVATDVKLWIKRDINLILQKIKILKISLVSKSEESLDISIPGLTHFQTAQPISLAHHLMAYYEMFSRDTKRFNETKIRMNENPLGSCALAGTSFKIDRYETTRLLGFKNPTKNSIDSVSDRDFIMDYIYSASICSIHLSRIAEEIILWSSDLIGFLKLGDDVMSSSSIMPQKKNPDAMELVRAKTSIIISNLNSMQNIIKSLPLAYSKDLQEDKKLITSTSDILKLCLDCVIEVINGLTFNKKNMYNAIRYSYANLNYSFRKSHSLTSQIVNFAEEKSKYLNELSIIEFKLFEQGINESVYNSLDIKKSINSKKSYGGTATSEIKKMIKIAKKECDNE